MSAPVLALQGAGYRYAADPVFEGVDLAISPGEIVTVLGTNGSGKSTLLRCLGGVLRPTSGSALLEGRDVASISAPERARSIGFLFQDHWPSLPFSVREVVQMGRNPHLTWLGAGDDGREPIVAEAMAQAGIEVLADRPYTTLSGGERQLVLFARTLAQQPKVILLDEPLSHLDLRNQVRCLGLVRRLAGLGVALVISTHDPNHAFVLGGRVVTMRAGVAPRVGSASSMLTPETLSEIYGIPIRVHPTPRQGDAPGAAAFFCSPW